MNLTAVRRARSGRSGRRRGSQKLGTTAGVAGRLAAATWANAGGAYATAATPTQARMTAITGRPTECQASATIRCARVRTLAGNGFRHLDRQNRRMTRAAGLSSRIGRLIRARFSMADCNMLGPMASYIRTRGGFQRRQGSTTGPPINRSPLVYPGIVVYSRADWIKERTMRATILAAITAIGLGFAGSMTAVAAPVYGPALGAAAEALDMTQHVWWRYGYHGHRGGWCWRHPRRC